LNFKQKANIAKDNGILYTMDPDEVFDWTTFKKNVEGYICESKFIKRTININHRMFELSLTW
jgi:hypothetical protein